MELRQLLHAGLAATYMTLAGCGASTTQATTATTPEPVAEETSSEQECPPRLLYIDSHPSGARAFFDSDGDGRTDYMEIRLVTSTGLIAPRPYVYGWDRNGDGNIDPNTPGEILYDPAMDGLNGNEMTLEQFRRFQQGQREHPTPPLESRLLQRSLSAESIVYASISPRS